MCSLHIAHRREPLASQEFASLVPHPGVVDVSYGVAVFRYATAGGGFHRWKLGFSQSRLHHASRTCGASCYIPSHLAAFPPCCFPLEVSPLGRVGVLEGSLALNLLPLRGYLMSAETAHAPARTFLTLPD